MTIDLRQNKVNLEPEQNSFTSDRRCVRRWYVWGFWISLIIFCLIAFVTYVILSPVGAFTTPKIIDVQAGTPLSAIANKLRDAGIIRSASLLEIIAKTTGRDTRIIAGPYRFDGTDGMLTVLNRLSSGLHGIALVRITIPEGFTRAAIADTCAAVLPAFSRTAFLEETKGEEGFLFPDTYEFFETATSGDVAERLRATFADRVAPLKQLPRPNGASFNDVVIMASIIEKEVSDPNDRRIVSGILWNRLAIGMPLQVDAVFQYAIARGSAELTQEDLRSDSPYNTYTRKGLPPTAIGSPSKDALLAALQPIPTPYVYYLSGNDGTTHYAKTFEEHKLNKAKYLR